MAGKRYNLALGSHKTLLYLHRRHEYDNASINVSNLVPGIERSVFRRVDCFDEEPKGVTESH
jgi:hypothetical protein